MFKQTIAAGTVHKLPSDLKKALLSRPKVVAAWEDLNPLARNEWICWSITVKQAKTRREHIKRTVTELLEGKRRPCCWIRCIHRTDKAISKTQQWMLGRQSKAK